GRIGPSVALRDLQELLPLRQLDARTPHLGACRDLGLVDAVPTRDVDRQGDRIGTALEVPILQPGQHFAGHGMALAAIGRNGAGRPALGPANRKDALALRIGLAGIADADDEQVELARLDRLDRRSEYEIERDGLRPWLVAGEAAQDFQVLGLAKPLWR